MALFTSMMGNDQCVSLPTDDPMILDSDLTVSPIEERAMEVFAEKPSPALPWLSGAAFCLYLAAVVVLQVLSGAYRSEFSAYPDEAAHYVTSTMVWEFCRHLHFASPLQFAHDYYDHYPKVALGHWPPFFYVVQALWMLVFSASRASVRLEIAVTTALLAYSLFFQARKHFGWKPALLAGLICVCLPLVQTYSDEEMAEILLTLVGFWSACYLARFAASEGLRDALGFGLFFALAVLTKGSGWLIAMMPPVVFLAVRKPKLFLSRAFLIAIGLVLVVCVPWQWVTMRMAERGWEGGSHPSVSYTTGALGEFLTIFPSIMGWVLSAVLLIGILAWFVFPFWRKNVQPLAASLFSLLLGVWIFHSVVPVGVEDRKLIMGVPAMIMFVIAGGTWIARVLPTPARFSRWRPAAVTAALAGCFFLEAFTIPRVEHYGFDQVARFISSNPQWVGDRILVSSNSVGEGLVISELAMVRPVPNVEVVRATKALARVDWNGGEYRCLFSRPAELRDFVARRNIRLIVVDRFAPLTHYLHDDLVKSMVSDSSHFRRVGTFRRPADQGAGQIEVYQAGF